MSVLSEPITADAVEIIFEQGHFIPVVHGVEVVCIRAVRPDHLVEVVLELKDIIRTQFESEDNYGLAFYACGYDGTAQDRFAQYYLDEYDVSVF